MEALEQEVMGKADDAFTLRSLAYRADVTDQ
jgi:hypothetical protein